MASAAVCSKAMALCFFLLSQCCSHRLWGTSVWSVVRNAFLMLRCCGLVAVCDCGLFCTYSNENDTCIMQRVISVMLTDVAFYQTTYLVYLTAI